MMRRAADKGEEEIKKERTNNAILMHHYCAALVLWVSHRLFNYDLEAPIFRN